MTWRLNPLASLHWRCWNDEWAVFDVGSGQTHQLDTLTAVTLMMLEAHPAGLPDLVSRLAQELLLPGDQTLQAALAAVLARLQGAGLIEGALP